MSCVEVRPKNGETIVIDAGTGIRKLGQRLMNQQCGDGKGKVHLLISHTHWDHIQGLPFFSPLYTEGNDLFVYARQREDKHLQSIFATQNEGPYFPVPLDSMKANVDFRELAEGQQFDIGDAKVSCTRLNHPWIAMAYRIDVDGASIVYSSDTAPFTDILLEQEFIAQPPELGAPISSGDAAKLKTMRDGLVELSKGADLLIYDTQFTPEEYRAKPHWGHSTPDDAIAVARDAGVKTVALYHHAPTRTDDQQDAIVAEYREATSADELDLIATHEGMELTFGEHD